MTIWDLRQMIESSIPVWVYVIISIVPVIFILMADSKDEK